MRQFRPLESWRNDETARAYGEFVQRFPVYRETSRSLVRRLQLRPEARVLDLACGTGATTVAVLEALGPAGEVVAVDGSPAMLDVARATVVDGRVAWVESELEELSVDGPFDAAVCNSAIWQTDTERVIGTVAELLVAGGRFAFNIGSQFVVGGPPPARRRPSLVELMTAFAILDHDYVPLRPIGPPPGRGGGPLTVERVTDMARTAGFEVEEAGWEEHPSSVEQERAWLSIPIFTELPFAGLTYEQRMDVLEKAYRRVDPVEGVAGGPWAVFVGRKR